MSDSQGAKANASGQKSESAVKKILKGFGYNPVRLSYKPANCASGVYKRRTDHYVSELSTIFECKHQDVGGTADQKLENEIWNATLNFTNENMEKNNSMPISHYVIVLTGSHWDKPGANHKVETAKKLVGTLKENGLMGDLKTLEIIRKDELSSRINSLKLTNDNSKKPSNKKYELREITREKATELVQANHYSPVMPRLTKVWLGIFKQEEFVGVVTLGWGTRPLHTIQKIVSKDLTSQDYYEIGKMCLLDSELRNSESQMLSQLVKWIKDVENKRRRESDPPQSEVQYLYTLADGIMGKCGYVYQAANFHYGGEYWTDSYMTDKGEKVHPRTTSELCKDNWKWHYTQGSPGFSEEFKANHDQKVSAAIQNNSKAPKKQVFWLTPEFLNHKGMKKIKGKMFRYIFPLNKKAKKKLKLSEEIEWKIGTGVYPKENSLKWRQMVARKKYEDLGGIPSWDLSVVEYNKKNVNAHKKKSR